MYGLIGKKVKMSQIFNDNGHVVPVTLIQAGPCTVSQVKTADSDGYNSVQLAFGKKSKRNTNKPTAGHLKKAGIESAKTIAEFKSVDGFEGEGDFISKFGLQIKDQITFTVAKRRFGELGMTSDGRGTMPHEGDLIFFPTTSALFQILFVFHSIIVIKNSFRYKMIDLIYN